MTSYLAQTAPAARCAMSNPRAAHLCRRLLRAVRTRDLAGASTVSSIGASVARIGARTFARLRHVAPDHVLIAPENRICITMLDLLNVEGLVAGNRRARCRWMCWTACASRSRARRWYASVSGGNFDFERLPEVKERAMRFAGTKKIPAVAPAPTPRARCAIFWAILGPEDDIAPV